MDEKHDRELPGVLVSCDLGNEDSSPDTGFSINYHVLGGYTVIETIGGRRQTGNFIPDGRSICFAYNYATDNLQIALFDLVLAVHGS